MKVKISYKNLNDLKDTFAGLGGETARLGISLIDEAMFCGDTLTKLKEQVRAEGVVTEMCQGKYSIQRANPALNAYNITLKNYQALLKQITGLLPNGSKVVDDGFDEF